MRPLLGPDSDRREKARDAALRLTAGCYLGAVCPPSRVFTMTLFFFFPFPSVPRARA